MYQGVQCRTTGDPVLYLSNPTGLDRRLRRRPLNALAQMNKAEDERSGDPETLTRIAQDELAYRCLLARRLVENGARFVQLYDWGGDHHSTSLGESVDGTLPIKTQQIDRAIAGLLIDLEQCGFTLALFTFASCWAASSAESAKLRPPEA